MSGNNVFSDEDLMIARGYILNAIVDAKNATKSTSMKKQLELLQGALLEVGYDYYIKSKETTNNKKHLKTNYQESLEKIFKQTLRITTHTDLTPRFLGFGKNTKSYKAAKDNLNLAKNTLKIKEQDWKSVIYGFSDDMKKLGIKTFKKAENKMALFEKSLPTSIEKTQTQKIENTNYFYREFCSFFKTSESNNAPKV
ncbi:hypothetical protein L3V86_01750 [Thiotrichales bacterium 19S11-10]|nr:hypothetical protein [Thiotrichales bacterium 19S11-10]